MKCSEFLTNESVLMVRVFNIGFQKLATANHAQSLELTTGLKEKYWFVYFWEPIQARRFTVVRSQVLFLTCEATDLFLEKIFHTYLSTFDVGSFVSGLH
jgi:hypothetical protein